MYAVKSSNAPLDSFYEKCFNSLPKIHLIEAPPIYAFRQREYLYRLEINCDFRLICDADIVALEKPPELNFNIQAMAMYGGSKYDEFEWGRICKFLNIDFPKLTILKNPDRKNNFKGYTYAFEYRKYINKKVDENVKLFPTFNNGVIFLRNDKCTAVANEWRRILTLYRLYVKERDGISIQGGGQDVIGLAINSVCDSWEILPNSMHYLVISKRDLENEIICTKKEPALLHYSDCRDFNYWFPKIIALAKEAITANFSYNQPTI